MTASVKSWKIATFSMAVTTVSLATALVVGHISIPESRADVRDTVARKTTPAAMQAVIDTCNRRADT